MLQTEYKGGVKNRQKRALERLKAQLQSGTKPEKNLHPLTRATTGGNNIPLEKEDIERIKKEINILEGRI